MNRILSTEVRLSSDSWFLVSAGAARAGPRGGAVVAARGMTLLGYDCCIQVNSRTHRPQKLKMLNFSVFQSGIGFKCRYSNRPLKALTPLNRLNAIFVLAVDRIAKSPHLLNCSMSSALDLYSIAFGNDTTLSLSLASTVVTTGGPALNTLLLARVR
jgi:hypothetical protein